jgi:predicted transcriptional regulator
MTELIDILVIAKKMMTSLTANQRSGAGGWLSSLFSSSTTASLQLLQNRTIREAITDPEIVASFQGKVVLDVAPHESIITVANEMSVNRVTAALVVDGESLLGIVTERDIVSRLVAKNLDPYTTVASDIMTSNLEKCTPDITLSEAMGKMLKKGFRHLPVMMNPNLASTCILIDALKLAYLVLKQQEEEAKTSAASSFVSFIGWISNSFKGLDDDLGQGEGRGTGHGDILQSALEHARNKKKNDRLEQLNLLNNSVIDQDLSWEPAGNFDFLDGDNATSPGRRLDHVYMDSLEQQRRQSYYVKHDESRRFTMDNSFKGFPAVSDDEAVQIRESDVTVDGVRTVVFANGEVIIIEDMGHCGEGMAPPLEEGAVDLFADLDPLGLEDEASKRKASRLEAVGDTLMLRGQYYAAIEKYSEALSSLPSLDSIKGGSIIKDTLAGTRCRLLFNRASAFNIDGNAAGALKDYNSVCDLMALYPSPIDSDRVYAGLSEVLFELKMFPDAVEAIKKINKRDIQTHQYNLFIEEIKSLKDTAVELMSAESDNMVNFLGAVRLCTNAITIADTIKFLIPSHAIGSLYRIRSECHYKAKDFKLCEEDALACITLMSDGNNTPDHKLSAASCWLLAGKSRLHLKNPIGAANASKRGIDYGIKSLSVDFTELSAAAEEMLKVKSAGDEKRVEGGHHNDNKLPSFPPSIAPAPLSSSGNTDKRESIKSLASMMRSMKVGGSENQENAAL